MDDLTNELDKLKHDENNKHLKEGIHKRPIEGPANERIQNGGCCMSIEEIIADSTDVSILDSSGEFGVISIIEDSYFESVAEDCKAAS